MQIVEVAIGTAAILSILFFLIYVIGLFRLPTGRRPETPSFNRFGEPLPPTPNPGFQETEEEREQE